ncbi:hypothetical protein [Bacillus tropicus]
MPEDYYQQLTSLLAQSVFVSTDCSLTGATGYTGPTGGVSNNNAPISGNATNIGLIPLTLNFQNGSFLSISGIHIVFHVSGTYYINYSAVSNNPTDHTYPFISINKNESSLGQAFYLIAPPPSVTTSNSTILNITTLDTVSFTKFITTPIHYFTINVIKLT